MKLILASGSLGRKTLLESLKISFEIMESSVDEEKIQSSDPIEMATLRAKAKASAVAEEIMRKTDLSETVKQYDSEIVKRKNYKNIKQIYGHTVSPSHGLTEKVVVIGADTVGFLGSWVFGKSKTRQEAEEMLARLSGKTHRYVSAFTVIKIGNNISDSVRQQDGDIVNRKGFENKKQIYSSTVSLYHCLTEWDISSVTFRKLTEEDIKIYLDRVEFLKLCGAFKINDSPQNFVTKVEGSMSNIIGISLEKLVPILQKEGLLTMGLK
jgi:septum formation protein